MTEHTGIPQIFDRQRLISGRKRAQGRFKDHGFLCDYAAAQLTDRLLDIRRSFKCGVLFGNDRISEQDLQAVCRNAGNPDLLRLDIVDSESDVIATEEELPFGKNTLDLIVSHLNLHTLNDLPGALIQMNYALKPDGLFIGSMFGGETLYELRQVLMRTETELKGGVSPRVLPFADKQQMGALLQRAGFALPVVDCDIITVTYPDLQALADDLRGMGEGNIISDRPKTYPGRAFFERARDIYHEDFSDADGRLEATFEIIYLIGWAPHDSQQQPLRPGSAENNLADALGATEVTSDVPTGK